MKTETLLVRELAERLMQYAQHHPDSKIWGHWEGWVQAPIGSGDLWRLPNGDLLLDCNDAYDKLPESENTARVFGGVEIVRE